MTPSRLGLLAVAFAASACSSPDPDEHVQASLPPFESFPPVGEALGARCGSLDCHGDVARNFRLYDGNGLRLGGALVSGGGLTTDAELAANYQSVALLEPELTSLVYREGGARPERLTLVRKGRGTEQHEGGVAMSTGGTTDTCLLSFLAGSTNVEACNAATEVLRPE